MIFYNHIYIYIIDLINKLYKIDLGKISQNILID